MFWKSASIPSKYFGRCIHQQKRNILPCLGIYKCWDHSGKVRSVVDTLRDSCIGMHHSEATPSHWVYVLHVDTRSKDELSYSHKLTRCSSGFYSVHCHVSMRAVSLLCSCGPF